MIRWRFLDLNDSRDRFHATRLKTRLQFLQTISAVIEMMWVLQIALDPSRKLRQRADSRPNAGLAHAIQCSTDIFWAKKMADQA